MNQKRENAYEYYVKNNELCADKKFALEKYLIWMHWAAAIAFLFPFLFLSILIIRNN